ncbi:MAG: hypothetical protein J1F09_01455 [Oscillospiraceae bacterium]|nr:hypothetical protein [Oscillospiraceae bacterium]
MAFIKEKVLEKLELFESFNLTYDGKKRKVSEATNWYVDTEREIYFVWLGGGALETPKTYALIWKNRKAIIDVETRLSIDKTTWIMNMIASKQLESQKSDLMNILGEITFIMYKGKKVELQLLSDIEFVEEKRLNG